MDSKRAEDAAYWFIMGAALASICWMVSSWRELERARDEGAYFARLEDHLAATGWQEPADQA